jgi:hypothetical protein
MEQADTIAIINIIVTVILALLGWMISWKIAKAFGNQPNKTQLDLDVNKRIEVGERRIPLRKAYLFLAIIIGISILGLILTLFYPPKPCVTSKDLLVAMLHTMNLTWSSLAAVIILGLVSGAKRSALA